MDNPEIAKILREIADILESQGANPFRVRAYRQGADTLEGLEIPVQSLLNEKGIQGLKDLPHIGTSLSEAIVKILATGSLPLLKRLRGSSEAEHLLSTIPGLGEKLAHQIHEELQIDNLDQLEEALRDGRLREIPGMGPKRLTAIRESLEARTHHEALWGKLDSSRIRPVAHGNLSNEPGIAELLDIDSEYFREVKAGHLPKITPHKFNPTHESWLPILHAQRGERHYSVMFSNTAHAHEMGATHDWVVIYRDDHGGEGRWTVITSRFGKLRGKRIIRGREQECEAYYSRA